MERERERLWSSRLRWRLRGAWLAPLVVVLVVVDGLLLSRLPISGEGPDLVGGLLLAAFLNLVAVAALAPIGGLIVRTARPDLPGFVARDRVGVVLVLLLAAGLLSAGLVHRGELERNRAAQADALELGRAWIGAQSDPRAAEFRRHVELADIVPIVDGSVYRVCVPSLRDPDSAYCAVVDLDDDAIRYAGAESNAHFSTGTR
jgi:hypothetical protein